MSKYTYELQLRDSRRSSWWTDYVVNSLFITKDEKIDAAKKWKRIWDGEDFRVVRKQGRKIVKVIYQTK